MRKFIRNLKFIFLIIPKIIYYSFKNTWEWMRAMEKLTKAIDKEMKRRD